MLREGKTEMEVEKGMDKKEKPKRSLAQKDLRDIFTLEPLPPDAIC